MKINKNTIGFVVLIALLLVASAVSLRLFLRERTMHDKVNINTFPMTVGEWKGRSLEIKDYEYKLLETRNLISREYANPSGEKLYLFIIYSETNRSVFHPPEVCMLGSGLNIIDKQLEKINSDGKVFSTNKLYAEKDKFKELVLYSYKAGDLYTNNFYLQQAYLALHQVFGKLTPGATIRVSMSIGSDEHATLATLKDFLGKTVGIVDGLSS